MSRTPRPDGPFGCFATKTDFFGFGRWLHTDGMLRLVRLVSSRVSSCPLGCSQPADAPTCAGSVEQAGDENGLVRLVEDEEMSSRLCLDPTSLHIPLCSRASRLGHLNGWSVLVLFSSGGGNTVDSGGGSSHLLGSSKSQMKWQKSFRKPITN